MGRERSTRRRDLWLLGIAAAVAVALAAALAVTAGGDDSRADSARGGSQLGPVAAMGPLGDIARRVPGDPLAVGALDAPVVMVQFSDFRCPFCAQFSRDTEPALIDKYVDAGVLRIEWRDLPIFGDQSFAAARAGRAAAAQGKFWEFAHAVYATAPQTGHPDLTMEALTEFARVAGVPDIDRFTAAAAGATFDEAISRDANSAQSLGIPATPAFSVNGTPVLGAQPIAQFEALIDSAAGLQ